MISSESKIIGAICHGSVLVGMPIVIPLVVYLLKKDDDFVRHHARESLAMHIIGIILSILVTILCAVLIGFLLIIPLGILALIYTVFGIIAVIKSLSGEYYCYPITTRFAESWFKEIS
ncbi:MAG: DUF4870 domain-containing protein [Clostridiales bacterium]|nr:DUF4870 domain-containing protein [Clostridiales bacterium]MCF8021882.1 DUF4870 domain-containing protein [Clostridiales bacterium]